MSGPVPNPGIMAVPDYFQGASAAEGIDRPLKLSSNENAYGPSPKAVEAICAAAADAHLYPEGQATVLNDALSRHHGLATDQIVTSTGSDDLIPTLIRAFAAPGDEVLYFADSFPKYANYVLGAGCRPVVLPRAKEADYAVRLDDVEAALGDRTRALLLDNPCNPTGTALSIEELRALHAVLPRHVILALDEAYVEFSDVGDGGLALAAAAPNVVAFRTFSKAYGLAGMRVGWCIGAREIVAALRRLRPSFPITAPSIEAAVAALADQAHMTAAVGAIRKTRDRVIARLRAAGWQVPSSQGNFFLVRYAPTAPMDVEAAQRALLAEGVLARPLTIQGDERVLRVTVGTDQQMTPVLCALEG